MIVQAALAVRFFGFLTGDDVEVLSEAFRRATGLAFTPWDVRNLFIPDVVVAPFVAAAKTFTADTALLIDAATIPFIALSALTIWMVHRLALRWSGDELAAFTATLLFAFHWIPLGFGSTVYPRNLATACIVAAALIVDRAPFGAGGLTGIAFADRFSEVVYLIPLVIVGKQRLRIIFGAIVAATIAVGVYDWITWGSPFSSAIKFTHLTLVEPDFASRVKYQSPFWYLLNVVRWCAPTLLPLLYFGRKSTRWSFLIVPLVAFSIVRHKELRYVQGMIPFLAIGAGAGFAILYRRRRALAATLLAISLLWDLQGLRYFAHKSMPAVMAARAMIADAHIRVVALSQPWAYGDKLYLGGIGVRDVGTPPQDLEAALVGADAAAIYESDLDHPELIAALRAHGFSAWRTFRDGPARAVVVYRLRR